MNRSIYSNFLAVDSVSILDKIAAFSEKTYAKGCDGKLMQYLRCGIIPLDSI